MSHIAFQWISTRNGKKWMSTLQNPKDQRHIDNYIRAIEKKGHILDEIFK